MRLPNLAVIEKYKKNGGTEKWPAWDIYPGSPWNYGLILDKQNPEKSFEVVKKKWPDSNMPFTLKNAPVEIKAKARRIPGWQLNDQGLVGKIPHSPVETTEIIETVTLVPMGAARLRISAFPVCIK